jgi:ComF family protein
MNILKEIKDSLAHLVFPHVCEGCGSDLLDEDNMLCLHCLSILPLTSFHLHSNNPIEKIFWGRLPVTHASAQYYYAKESLVQRIMNRFKYRGNKELGTYLGNLMGQQLQQSNRYLSIDAIVPLPIHPAKERARGFNQSAVLCEGIAQQLQKPVINDAVIRTTYTDTQTKKNRVERLKNMEGRFELVDKHKIEGKHILLVDDIITTGATLEVCGRELLSANMQLSMATLCFSSK